MAATAGDLPLKYGRHPGSLPASSFNPSDLITGKSPAAKIMGSPNPKKLVLGPFQSRQLKTDTGTADWHWGNGVEAMGPIEFPALARATRSN